MTPGDLIRSTSKLSEPLWTRFSFGSDALTGRLVTVDSKFVCILISSVVNYEGMQCGYILSPAGVGWSWTASYWRGI